MTFDRPICLSCKRVIGYMHEGKLCGTCEGRMLSEYSIGKTGSGATDTHRVSYPCTSLVTYTLRNGATEHRKIERDTQMEVFEQICTEGVRIEMRSSDYAAKIKRVEIILERDE